MTAGSRLPLVLASILGDAWRLGITVVVLAALVGLWYFMMSRMGTF